jgi:hypothetical protein
MQPTTELIDALYRERVLRARRMSLQEKFVAGPEIFERVCRLMKDGIRNEHPGADEARVHELLVQRLALARRLEQSP